MSRLAPANLVAAVLECDGTSGSLALEQEMAERFMLAFNIFKERQRKYGCGNIAKRGPAGVLVRMDDKLARLEQLMETRQLPTAPIQDFKDESVRDTLLDIANYALIMSICLDGEWPGWPHPTMGGSK